jgi:hypothetical protein
MSTAGAPKYLTYPSFNYNGSKLVIWSGNNGGTRYNFGGVYDVAAGTWSTISSTNAPTERANIGSALVNDQLIVWGGANPTTLNSGAIYDVTANTWSTMSVANAPSPRGYLASAWTGSRLLVWGGYNYPNTGGIYDPGFTDTTAPTVVAVTSDKLNGPLFGCVCACGGELLFQLVVLGDQGFVGGAEACVFAFSVLGAHGEVVCVGLGCCGGGELCDELSELLCCLFNRRFCWHRVDGRVGVEVHVVAFRREGRNRGARLGLDTGMHLY